MAPSPMSIPLSPRPNPPGPGAKVGLHPKAKALAVSNATPGTASGQSTPGMESDVDVGAQLNAEVRNQYIIKKNIGHGTYADVYTAALRTDPTQLFAIKSIRKHTGWTGGISMDAIRETRCLREMSHPNIITLHAVYTTKDQKINLVLEYLPLGTLEDVWKDSLPYGSADVKSWMLMLSRAIWFCHQHRILHRDVKSNNCLIAQDGTLKLADFGMARVAADPGRRMTMDVVTLWYKAPELLYKGQLYGPKIDVFSAGMVMAELAQRQFFCPGATMIAQLALYNDVFGTNTDETWPGVSKLPDYIAPTEVKRGQPLAWWRGRFGLLGEDGVDLLRGMLVQDPRGRLGSDAVLKHAYWTNAPRPTEPNDLPRKGGKSEDGVGDGSKRPGGEAQSGRGDKVARKLDFGAMLR